MSETPRLHLTESLHRAIHAGLIHKVEKLINDGAEMDRVFGMRGTALCAAIEARNIEIVRYLLNQGCDVNARDFDGEPPILLALRKDSPGHISGRIPSPEIVEILIKHEQCNVNKVDRLTKKRAIHFAVEQGMVDAVNWMLAKNGRLKCDVNAVDMNGNTPLHLAVHEGVFNVVNVLVNHQECLLKVYNKAGLTPIHICCNTGDCKSLCTILEKLKKLGPIRKQLEQELNFDSEHAMNVNAVTMFEKETPLHLAVRNGYEDVVSILLDNQAQVNVKNNLGNTPLMLSMVSFKQWETRNNAIPKALLKKGANVNIRSTVRCRFLKPHSDVTPLIIAVHNGNLDLVQGLIKNGSDVNLADNNGDTPLMIALKQGEQKIATFLVNECKDINVNIQNSQGESCLHAPLKCFKHKEPKVSADLVRSLIRQGADMKADITGKTVIEKAIDYENHVVLDTILDELHETSLTYLNKLPVHAENDHSLIHVAVVQGSLDIVKVLLSYGANINERTKTGHSNLFIALYNRENKLATYLVENGCDLKDESFIFIDCDANRNDKRRSTESENDSDSSSESSDFDSDDSTDIFHGDCNLKEWIRSVAFTPRSLKLLCLITIRKHFVENKIAFNKVDLLPLPELVKSRIRYKV